jgi:hypothetical protein
MSKLAIASAIMILLLVDRPQSDKFSKYKTVEAYEVRPGILMIPSYTADGHVCEIGLEKRLYSPQRISLDAGLSRKEIEQIVDELAPDDERGSKTKAHLGLDEVSRIGQALVTTSEYENISILIYSAVVPTSTTQGVVTDDVAAKIRWNNRKCR